MPDYTIYKENISDICDVNLPKPTYSLVDVENYFAYRLDYYDKTKQKQEHKIEHGILAGFEEFQKLVQNYLDNRAIYDNQDSFYFCHTDSKGREHSLFGDKAQIEAFALVADAVIVHNIWFTESNRRKKRFDEDDYNTYKEKGLDNFIRNDNNGLNAKKSPLAFLLTLVDTIEPLKYFVTDSTDTDKILDLFKNIQIKVCPNKILIKKNPACEISTDTGYAHEWDDWFKGNRKEMSLWMQGVNVRTYKRKDGHFLSATITLET